MLHNIAVAVALAGQHDRAEAIARTIQEDPYSEAEVLLDIAAKISDRNRSQQLAANAATIAQTIEDHRRRAWALTSAAKLMGQAGDKHRARQFAAEAEETTAHITPSSARALGELAIIVSEAGDNLHAACLFARALAMDDREGVIYPFWWLTEISKCFPADTRDTLGYLVDAYET